MGKKINPVKMLLDDEEMLDLAHLADEDNRSPSEMARVILRLFLYGRVQRTPASVQRYRGAHEDRSGPAWADTEGRDS